MEYWRKRIHFDILSINVTFYLWGENKLLYQIISAETVPEIIMVSLYKSYKYKYLNPVDNEFCFVVENLHTRKYIHKHTYIHRYIHKHDYACE